MKKTPHGKRHIRARASVQAGREKRRLRKLKREIDGINLFFNLILPKLIADVMPQVIEAFNNLTQAALQMGKVFSEQMMPIVKAFQELNNESPTT